jgi:superfamily II DNA or RNA helicase
MKTLRPYQQDAVDATLHQNRGIVCLPTGSGKTTIQARIVFNHASSHPGHRVYLVLAPRIVLAYQLMKEYFIEFNSGKIPMWYAGVHSGGEVEIKEFEQARDGDLDFQHIRVTTSSGDIRAEIDKARVQNLPIIIFSTYHSADRAGLAMDGQAFDVIVCDEAHNLVTNQFDWIVKPSGLQAHQMLFFTATMQTTASDTGRGMNNKLRFGPVLFQRIPREMIEDGFMVRPRMHIVKFDQDLNPDDLIQNAGKVVAECFGQHEYIANRTGKILVTCTGTQMMESILKSPEIRNLKRRKGVSVYAVASDPEIGNQIDGEQMSRQEFLRRLRVDGQKISQEMIILHIDILTEGIDVPGITGILPFRSLQKSKFIQTFGRASRISMEDLESFREGEYHHHQLDKMMKPYAWVMFPDIQGEDTAEDIRNLIVEMRNYGFNPTEDIFISNDKGKMPPVTLMTPQSKPDRNNKALQEVLEELHHEFEEEAIANLLAGATLDEMLAHFE